MKGLSTKETRERVSGLSKLVSTADIFDIAELSANWGDVESTAAWLREVPRSSGVARTQKAEVVTRALKNSSRDLEKLSDDLWKAKGFGNKFISIFAGGEAITRRKIAGKITRKHLAKA